MVRLRQLTIYSPGCSLHVRFAIYQSYSACTWTRIQISAVLRGSYKGAPKNIILANTKKAMKQNENNFAPLVGIELTTFRLQGQLLNHYTMEVLLNCYVFTFHSKLKLKYLMV